MSQTVAFKLGGTFTLFTEPDQAGAFFTIRYRDFTIRARAKDMAYKLPSGMQVDVQVSYVDTNGNPAEVDGEVTWDSSHAGTLEVEVDRGDSTKATIKAIGPVGQAQVTATADADLGTGTRELITPMDVEVVAGEAVSGTIAPVGEAKPIG